MSIAGKDFCRILLQDGKIILCRDICIYKQVSYIYVICFISTVKGNVFEMDEPSAPTVANFPLTDPLFHVIIIRY